jgi:phosphatidylserine decarboxylase
VRTGISIAVPAADSLSSSEWRKFLPHMVKDGYRFALPPIFVGLACLFPHWYWAAGLLIFLGLFVCYFFRNPNRIPPSSSGTVVSPADGRVVAIVEETLDQVLGRRISIFLSIFNVHVQRAPLAGTIVQVVYKPGQFLGAYRSKASVLNEQNVIYMDTPQGRVVFKQIAGAIARRVLCWKREGETVALGERVGMIRFGSRVDIWLPMDAEIVAKQGQTVYGGESVLAKWNSTT